MARQISRAAHIPVSHPAGLDQESRRSLQGTGSLFLAPFPMHLPSLTGLAAVIQSILSRIDRRHDITNPETKPAFLIPPHLRPGYQEKDGRCRNFCPVANTWPQSCRRRKAAMLGLHATQRLEDTCRFQSSHEIRGRPRGRRPRPYGMLKIRKKTVFGFPRHRATCCWSRRSPRPPCPSRTDLPFNLHLSNPQPAACNLAREHQPQELSTTRRKTPSAETCCMRARSHVPG